ncbi:hypothetical protein NQ318_003372 [Aromia moschata]|uniref:Neuropeptide-like 1 n=1 Tax=Aromia moschata TaxID=1265417 RepID=A0AAV8YA60_9CUCU|nr:hypothetical protein NQ318_003372 [Aromia moschata]
MVRSDDACDYEVENALKTLLSSEDNSLQVQALRRELLRKFQEALERVDEEADADYKRSFSSLAAWNEFPGQKKNMEALARAGYLRPLPEEDDADASYKRSIAALAKNGQLPQRSEEQKRGLESLARSGDLHPKKDIQKMIDDLNYKRNIGSLARNYNFPSYGKRSLSSLARAGDLNYPRFQYKRNIASLARDGKFTGKRNMAALLRQDEYMNNLNKQSTESAEEREKRNLPSIKAQCKPVVKDTTHEVKRDKRDVDYYYEDNSGYPASVYQTPNVYDYEDLMQELKAAYPNNEKRFLGKNLK